MTLPSATLAVEAGLTDWATLRGFANHTYIFSCDNPDAMTDAAGTSYCGDKTSGAAGGNVTDWGFGLGFDWGQVNLDMTISTDLFTDPMSVITGYDDGGLTNSAVTLTYSF